MIDDLFRDEPERDRRQSGPEAQAGPEAPRHASATSETDESDTQQLPRHADAGQSPRHADAPTPAHDPAGDTAVLPRAGATQAHPSWLMRIHGLQLAGRRGHVFGPLDWEIRPGERAVVSGHQGTGRSALLLALAGRMKGIEGELHLDHDTLASFNEHHGTELIQAKNRVHTGLLDGIAHPRRLREQVSVARIGDLVELEPTLTVGECRDERAMAEGFGVRRGREQFTNLQNLLGEWFDLEEVVEHLPAARRTLLTAVLGCLRPSAMVVLDDLDASLTSEQVSTLHQQLDVLSDAGHTFVVSVVDEDGTPEGTNILRLGDPFPDSREPLAPKPRVRDTTPNTAHAPTQPATPPRHVADPEEV